MAEDLRTFQPGEPIFARRDFRHAGKPYKVGDRFNPRRLAVSKQQVQRMISAGFLTQKLSPKVEDKNPPVEEEEITREFLDTLDQDALYEFVDKEELDVAVEEYGEDLDALREAIWEALPEEDDEPTIVDRGGGWFDVFIGEDKQNESALRKPDAEKLVEELKGE